MNKKGEGMITQEMAKQSVPVYKDIIRRTGHDEPATRIAITEFSCLIELDIQVEDPDAAGGFETILKYQWAGEWAPLEQD